MGEDTKFFSSYNPHFQSKAICATFVVKMTLHNKDWPITLILKMRIQLQNGLLYAYASYLGLLIERNNMEDYL